MATGTVVLTTATTSAGVKKLASDNYVTVTVYPTAGATPYSTLSFTIEISIDGTNWEQISCVDNKTGLLIAGGTSISPTDATVRTYAVPMAQNYNWTRVNVSAIGGGSASFVITSASLQGFPLYTSVAGAAGAFTNLTASGTLAVTGASTMGSTLTITSVSTNALAVGRQGATNPVLQLDASTASVATGIKIKGAAAAAGCAVSVITSGTNENLTIDAAGSGTITLGGTSTGGITTPRSLLSTSATGGIGYNTGAGGAVTQLTSRTTGVTINNVTGAITLVSAAGQAGKQSFTVTNSAVAATDTIVLSQKSGTDKYDTLCVTAVAAGSFVITFANSAGTTTEQPVFNFAVLKGAAS